MSIELLNKIFDTYIWHKTCYCQMISSVINSVYGNRKHVKAKISPERPQISEQVMNAKCDHVYGVH